MNDYWQVQQLGKPLFGDALWNKPERRDQAGRLSIVGGNSGGFWSVALAYELSKRVGIGQTRVIMPDALRSKLPATLASSSDDLFLAPSNPSGGLSAEADKIMRIAASWSGNVLLVGDNGANSETAQLIERFVTDQDLADVKMTLTRDTVDLIIYGAEAILNRPKTALVISMAQLQKIARAVFYPRMIAFSLGIKQVVEILHKFTITYPSTVILFHDNNLVVASGGKVISQSFSEPMRMWSGEIATRSATWQVWVDDPISAIATSWTEL